MESLGIRRQAFRMENTAEHLVFAARLLTGLLAGLFFAYAVSVLPALHAMDDQTFTTVMNKINVVIVNPVFMVVFLGAPATAAAVLFWHRAPWSIAAAALAVATLVVTFAFNIPLNNALAEGGSRAAFETPWVVWNVVRTLTSIAAFVAILRVSP
jgi:uncharacterized membrane protein